MKNIKSFKQIVATIYLAVLFIIYPLYQKDHYYQMGVHKYNFYLYTTIVFIIAMVVAMIADTWNKPVVVTKGNNSKNKKKNDKDNNKENEDASKNETVVNKCINIFISCIKNASWVERFVWIYLLGTIISYLLGVDKELAMWGADGWNMGFVMQLILIASLFLFDYFWQEESYPIMFAMFGSVIVFIIGILNRFRIDPLDNYVGLQDAQVYEFLSTIGQVSWYGSYIITVFPIGLALYFIINNKSKVVKRITGTYLFITFMAIVTSDANGAYLSVAGVFVVLFWFIFDEKERLIRFLEIIMILTGAFTFTGVLQRVFADKFIDYVEFGDISFFLSKGPLAPTGLVIAAVLYIIFTKTKGGDKFLNELYSNRIKGLNIARTVLFILIGLVILAWPVTIYLNTNGYLNALFGGAPSMNDNLYFDPWWGHHRGVSWATGAKMFVDFPWYRKLFGIGPDSLEAWSTIEPYKSMIAVVFGDKILSCLHNEFFNSIICFGLVGGISYIGIFIAGIVRYMKLYKKNPIVIAGALCIVSYVAFDFFCYQTVCCTPFIFVIIGCVECICKKAQK